MVLKQVECPPKGIKNKGIPLLFKKWIPSMEKYAGDYIGLGDITGSTSNKRADKVAIGYNQFIYMGEKCDNTSEKECIGEDKYMYMRNYPLGKIPICKEKTKIIDSKEKTEHKIVGNIDLIGGTGLIGNLQEDIINLPIYDYFSATFNKKGPFASKTCMKATLPVGDGIAVDGRKFSNKEDAIKNGRGWWIESKCIPKQPTFDKRYGGQIFKIPFSKSKCIKELPKITENFEILQAQNTNYYTYIYTIINIILLLLLVTNNYINTNTKLVIFVILFYINISIIKSSRNNIRKITSKLKKTIITYSLKDSLRYLT